MLGIPPLLGLSRLLYPIAGCAAGVASEHSPLEPPDLPRSVGVSLVVMRVGPMSSWRLNPIRILGM
jgi:hypothetical protein